MKPFLRSARVPAAALLGLALMAPSAAQTFELAEDFEDLEYPQSGEEGPRALIDHGWTFRNQSEPLGGTPAWTPGGGPAWPNSGQGYLEASSTATDFLSGKLSSWAILPPVPGQAAGDVFSVWILGGGSISADTFLDVRYSPSGGTDTGSGPFDVGDFTQVLHTTELGPMIYTQIAVDLPGPGPVALRFHAPGISNFAGKGATLWLDTLTVGDLPGVPCGLDLPEAGETVHWAAAGSPYTVCQDLVVPEGATLVIEPGATVQVEPGRKLIVEGSLRALGADRQPVVLAGDNVSGLWVRGDARLEHCDVDAGILVHGDATLEAYDSSFGADGWVTATMPRTFMRFERCELAADLIELHGTTVVEDVTIPTSTTQVRIAGFWNIHSLDSLVPIAFVANMQGRVIDNVSVTGVSGPAVELQAVEGAVDYHLGPNNVLFGNDYPVWARFAGLTPDSTVPTTGNANDAIKGVQNATSVMRSGVTLPDFGIPYHFLEHGNITGDARVEPGAVLRFGPLGGLRIGSDKGSDSALRGLPGEPIVLERLDPTKEWFSLATGPGWHNFEHLDVSGAGVGVNANEAELFLRDSVIHGCSIGAQPAADGNIYGSGVRFVGNQVGLKNDTTHLASQIKTGVHFSGVERPNLFIDNVLAAKNVPTTNGTLHHFPADHNWWNHPTGPFEEHFHPQGQGDPVTFGVDFQPFLTALPDLSDARPVVRLKTRLHPVVLPGEKIFIEWEAFDDGEITGFDVQVLDPDDLNKPAFTFLDLGADLPPWQRRFEVVVPDVGLHHNERFPFRIVARDDAGNTSYDEFQLIIPHQAPSATVAFHTELGTFKGGEDVPLCYDALGLNTSPRFYIETASDDHMAMGPAGHSGLGECTFSPARIPYASTDRARIALRAEGNWNRDEWYFTDYFTIRPDPRFGDEPPTVQMLTPADGQSFSGGTAIPITWTAGDDQGLREFRIQASFNGGYTYHTIATGIPGDARRYTWNLPATTGIDDLRVRVIAVDTLMQNTTDGDDRVLRVVPRQKAGRKAGGAGQPVQ